MKPYLTAFTYLLIFLPIFANGEPAAFNRYTEELTKLLETDAATVMVVGLTYDFSKKVCARLGYPIAQEVEVEVVEWRKRNDAFITGAAKVFNDFGERYFSNGGEQAKQEYFQMVLRNTTGITNNRLMRQFNGANLDNKVVPLDTECLGLAKILHGHDTDFDRTPEITRALTPYIERKNKY